MLLNLSRKYSLSPLRAAIIVAALVALLVRVTGLTRLDLGTDEAYSFLTAAAPDSVARLQSDTNPPLYFLLLKGWMRLFGTSLTAMRMLSVLSGTAAVAALGGLARRCGASVQTTMWVLLLAALTPLQVHYAQQARGYTLACLLLIFGLWTFVEAFETGRPFAWFLHAVCVALGIYTHNLLAPLAAGYFFVALMLRMPRRQLLAMVAAYAAAGVMAAPGIWLILHQSATSGGMAWLRPYWAMTPPALVIPRSLEVLSLGGNQPAYSLILPLPMPMQILSLVLCGLAAGACFFPARPGEISAGTGGAVGASPVDMRRYRPMLVTFTLWPLLFLLGYSCLRTPIYLVGRYDLFAQPTLLLLLAAGFSRLQTALRKRSPWLLPLLVSSTLTASLGGLWAYPLDPQLFHHGARAEYLASVMRPRDPILCTGLEAGPLLYHLERDRITPAVSTFPRDTAFHLGWIMSDEAIAARQDWPAEALAALDEAGSGHDGLWIVLDSAVWNPPSPNFAPSPRQQLSWLLVQTALDHGWRRDESNPAHESKEANLRIVHLTRVPPSPADARAAVP
jgi:hypothetical protein